MKKHRCGKLGLMFLCVTLLLTGCSIFEPDDLDDTYFPFGLGYEWTYQKVEWGYYDDETWYYCDTFTVTVVDSFWVGDTLFFECTNTGGFFLDLSHPVTICNNRTEVFCNWWGKGDTVRLQPKRVEYNDGEVYFEITFLKDTLIIISGYDWFPDISEAGSRTTTRLEEIGVISQSTSYGSPYSSNDTRTRLLTFTTPQSQVWP